MKYNLRKKAILLLADGTIFEGKSIGIEGTTTGEICFNTGMTGYQEIFTDPSYFGQLMVATNAHIGNYGVNQNEIESDGIKISGLICRNFSFEYSRADANGSLKDWFEKHQLVAISDVDTRALVSYIRDNGAMNAIVSTEIDNIDELKERLDKVPAMNGLELASKVSTTEPYYVGNKNAKYKVAALDIGIKKTLPRHNSIFSALCSLDLSTFKNRNEIDNELEKTISMSRIRQFLLKNIIRDKENGGYKWKMNLPIIRKNYETISDAVTHDFPYEGESLFIKGEMSDFILEEDKNDILELFPNAQFNTIPKSGHWVHAEQTEKLIDVVKDYLN